MRLFIISCSLEINQTSSDTVRPSNLPSLVGTFLLSAEVFSNWLRFFNSLLVVRSFLVCAEAFGNFSFVSFLIGERHHYYSITVGRFKSQPYRTEFLLSSYSPSRFLPIHIRSILCVFSTGEPCKDCLILTAIPCRENPPSEHFF